MGLYFDEKRIERIISGRKEVLESVKRDRTIIINEDFEEIFKQQKHGNDGVNPVTNRVIYHNLVFQNYQFNKCKCQNVEFNQCLFISCDFLSCSFQNVKFDNCHFCDKFHDPIAIDPLLIIDINWVSGCLFDKTSFTDVEFVGESIAFSIFLDTIFQNAKISYLSIINSIFYACNFNCIFSCLGFENTSFLNTKRFFVRVYETKGFIIDRFTNFHCAKLKEEHNKIRLYKERSMTYSAISELYMTLGYRDRSAEYDYYAKRNEGESYTVVYRMRSRLIDALCGFGERPSHTFICIVLSILLFGIFYLFSGFAINERVINGMTVWSTLPSFIGIIKLYCHSVFFSVTTFSTVGYGNYVPVGAVSSTLAAIQMLMGIFLTALWTGCIFRKMAR